MWEPDIHQTFCFLNYSLFKLTDTEVLVGVVVSQSVNFSSAERLLTYSTQQSVRLEVS